jgi:uncharacterized protein (DUF58 family)
VSASHGSGYLRFPTLTRAGRSVAAGAPLLLVGGWALGYRELATIAAVGVLALLAGVVSTWPRPRMEIERTVTPARVMRGDPARARLSVTMARRRLLLPSMVVVRDRVSERVVETRLPRSPGVSSATQLGYDLPTQRRGVVPVGPVGLVRADPLGLLETEVRLGHETSLLIYPRVYDLVPLSSGRRRDLDGATHDGASGSITFHALREYVTGDDLRLIHWRSTARKGSLMVREQTDPSRPHSTVILDIQTTSYATEDCFEAAVDAAASVVAASTRRHFPVRLVTTVGPDVAGGAARAADTTLLDHLTRLQLSATGTLAALTRRMAADPGGNSLVVITGGSDNGARTLVNALRRRYMTLAVVRFEPAAAPGTAWDREILDLVAPDAEAFAGLWNKAA